MTGETRELQRRIDRRQRRRVIVAVVATALIAVLVGWWTNQLTHRTQVEQQRADTAVSGAEQLCQQVRQLGGQCVVDPTELRGEPGEQGPAGPAGRDATDEQVRRAVETYFARNPPKPGRPPNAAEIAVAVINYLTEHPPAPGKPGKDASPEQVAAAVRAYLTENPPQAGPKGDKGDRGDQGPGPTAQQIADQVEVYLSGHPLPLCPVGSHVEEYKPPLDGRTFLVCTKN